MKKHNKIFIGIIVGLVVIIGVFAMSKFTDLDLLSGSITNSGPSGTVCRKISKAINTNDLYTDTLGDLNMTWDTAMKCGKKFPSLFKKVKNVGANEDNCSMLRDWLDEGFLSQAINAFRINGALASSCAQQFRDIWFDEEGDTSDNYESGNTNTNTATNNCELYHTWSQQGTLTSNFQSRNLDFNLAIDCSKFSPDIWYNENKCMVLKLWKDYQGAATLSRLMSLHNPKYTANDIGDCVQQNGGSWWNGNALYAPSPQPQATGPSCETVKQWTKQGVLTPNMNNLGLGGWMSIVTNCGNTCMLQTTASNTNNPMCDNFALWLKQGTLTPNMQQNGYDWSIVGNCGMDCLYRF